MTFLHNLVTYLAWAEIKIHINYIQTVFPKPYQMNSLNDSTSKGLIAQNW